MGNKVISVDEFVGRVTDDLYGRSPELVRRLVTRAPRGTQRTGGELHGIPKHAIALQVLERVYGAKQPPDALDFYTPIDQAASTLGVKVKHESQDYGGQLILNLLADALIIAPKARLVQSVRGAYASSGNGYRR